MPNRILVVDDDPIVCELIQEVLRSAEMEADAVTDSTRAAARLREEKFDAVLLDLRMPPPDGIELARRMRASGLNQSTPIVMITGVDDRDVMTRAFQAGVSFFLFKPVDRKRLLLLMRATQGSIQRERRRFRRVKVACKVSIESSGDRLNATILDLSMNGMLVQAPRVFAIGSLVRVRLELSPGKPPIGAAARVMRLVDDDCMGLCLQNLSMAESQQLQEFLLPLI